MTLQTRKPTGLPSWPIVLLAGVEKSGKTWAAIAASSSPLIGSTLYIGMGENDPDEYALIPGADFDIVEHDGTYQGIAQAVRDAAAEPPVDGKPTLLVVDSGTRLWNLIGDNVQAVANKRAKGSRNQLTADYTVSADLWNAAASQWTAVMDALRSHNGPVIITARLDLVMVMGSNGQPTNEKQWKVQGHKSLPFDVDAVVQMHTRGEFLLTGVRSVRVKLDRPRLVPEFTLEWLWNTLGITDGTGDRTHATVVADEPQDTPRARPIAERIKLAESALTAAVGSEAVEAVWVDIGKSKLQQQAPLVALIEKRRAEFPPADLTAAWDAKKPGEG